jgi:hypothetical protein
MKKVLITGATSSQYSIDAHKRNSRFSGLLTAGLNFSGVSAQMKSLEMDFDGNNLKEYDTVLIGLSPFSSLSANKSYTSLNTLTKVLESGVKFKIILDAPDPQLVYTSYSSIIKNPEIFTKSLYSSREGFKNVQTDSQLKNKLIQTIEYILTGDYDIVVPEVPYFEFSRDAYGIPKTSSSKTYSLNFDSIFSDTFHVKLGEKSKFWCTDNNNTVWAKKISATLSKPVLNLKRTQYDTDIDYIHRLQQSYGYLLPTYKNNLPWWSANTMLSLSCGIPVFSEWRHTQKMSGYWSVLPQTAEDMSHEQRYELSVMQKETYLAKTTTWEEICKISTKTVLS